MFIQVVEAKIQDRDLAKEAWAAWDENVKPHAIGWLGNTGGLTDDGRLIAVSRFESEAAANKNNDLPEQNQWYEKFMANLASEVSFMNCPEVDEMLGGGSNEAGFVQLIQGHCSDVEKMRSLGRDMEEELSSRRPDMLGGTVAWHADAPGDFTQTMYFKSEEEARKNEADQAMGGAPDEFRSLLSNLTFTDLHDPWFA
jgi:hypothetical protein